ncbi:arabinogalactan endo-1,4-beta-galactosidase [Mucilaginibacter sp. BJC16-A38]|uniref:glycoside hydrolase family 53 protein n=1 Tax=Mucilaginibacter phenanthrenivorans TaxID=1234842 RepID=UPI002157DE7B|nr:arabinogalactan endo-1,4-beta-galactosidase [Mucilaginibacter phenanthrenivorans]MCR8556851.1 arabinogalactan endo-1,4-beta-galactosidase [Mucilaginibacter phenanthrenivorans]
MMRKVLWFYCCPVLLMLSCSNKGSTQVKPTDPIVYKAPAVSSTFAKGADISWVTQMESSGYKFYDKTGKQQDLFALIKSLGFNSIRLRAWVNPADGWCNTNDVVAKALRAKAAGMKIMIDFHYADSWADPGKQPKPAAWTSLAFATLTTTLHDYTVNVMTTLKNNGITPDWVQVGNETNDGMLWEDGRASKSMANFAALIKSGYSAVKSISSTTKVIVHISNGFDNSLFRWMFDGLKANGAQWDIIGMSLYPSTDNWTTLDSQCLANIKDMVSRYSTPCMVVEVGMDAASANTSRDFLSDIVTKVNSVSGSNGLGVFYWEPEAYNWQSYGLGAFDGTGKPTVALDAFGN